MIKLLVVQVKPPNEQVQCDYGCYEKEPIYKLNVLTGAYDLVYPDGWTKIAYNIDCCNKKSCRVRAGLEAPPVAIVYQQAAYVDPYCQPTVYVINTNKPKSKNVAPKGTYAYEKYL